MTVVAQRLCPIVAARLRPRFAHAHTGDSYEHVRLGLNQLLASKTQKAPTRGFARSSSSSSPSSSRGFARSREALPDHSLFITGRNGEKWGGRGNGGRGGGGGGGGGGRGGLACLGMNVASSPSVEIAIRLAK